MSKKAQNIPSLIGKICLLLSSISALIYTTWGIAHLLDSSDDLLLHVELGVLITAIVILSLAWIFYLAREKIGVGPSLLLTSIVTTALIAELIFAMSITYGFTRPRNWELSGSLGVFNSNCAIYDSVSGYRWKPGTHRITNVRHGVVVFDTKMVVNRQGWVSHRDFEYKKKEGTKRYIVFGDSFTSAIFNEINWPDRLQQWLDRDDIPIELYSFAQDGGGIENWYSTFFNVIIPKYEFDGIILAVYGNDLARGFMIMHHQDNKAYVGQWKEQPLDWQDYKNNYMPKAPIGAWILTDEEIDAEKEKATNSTFDRNGSSPGLDLHLLNRINDVIVHLNYIKDKAAYAKKFETAQTQELSKISWDHFRSKYGQTHTMMVDSILSWCVTHDKKIITTALPDEKAILFNLKESIYPTQLEMQFLAKTFNGRYIDGFAPFLTLPPAQLTGQFLHNDNHWNQDGSDLFAEEFFEQLISE